VTAGNVTERVCEKGFADAHWTHDDQMSVFLEESQRHELLPQCLIVGDLRVSRSTVFDGHLVTVIEGVPGSGSRVL